MPTIDASAVEAIDGKTTVIPVEPPTVTPTARAIHELKKAIKTLELQVIALSATLPKRERPRSGKVQLINPFTNEPMKSSKKRKASPLAGAHAV
jgi:hypothetical protein